MQFFYDLHFLILTLVITELGEFLYQAVLPLAISWQLVPGAGRRRFSP